MDMAGAGFDEAAHPRDEKGKFSEGGGAAGAAGKPTSAYPSGGEWNVKYVHSKDRPRDQEPVGKWGGPPNKASALEKWAYHRDELQHQIDSQERAATTAENYAKLKVQEIENPVKEHDPERMALHQEELRVQKQEWEHYAKVFRADKKDLERKLEEHMSEQKGQAVETKAPTKTEKEVDRALGRAFGNKFTSYGNLPKAMGGTYRNGLESSQLKGLGKEQKRENERRESVGKPPMIPGSRDHKEFVEKARAQMRSARQSSSKQTDLPFTS